MSKGQPAPAKPKGEKMEKLIARRAKRGYNEAESALLLRELIEAHDGDNLECALVYNDFATVAGAAKFVASIAK